MTLDVAFIGTGADPDDPGREGFAMAYRHAASYRDRDDCNLVACADLISENAKAFTEAFDLDEWYQDYQEMLVEYRPDVVSVCVPPKAHADVVIGAAQTGVPRAIHCEKPMAATWGACREMADVCTANDVELTINHQRRFGKPFRAAKQLLDTGAIGDLSRIEFAEDNVFDAGTHLFDLAGYYTDQAEPKWVLAGIDYREENVWFGSHNETQAIVQWQYESGVDALAATGDGQGLIGCYLRLRGTDGTIEIGAEDGAALRVRRAGAGSWERVDTDGEGVHSPPSPGIVTAAVRKISDTFSRRDAPRTKPSYIDRSIADVVSAVQSNGRSELHASNALQSTELIFACWESVRRRGRVDLPLEIEDNPLEAMVESGVFDVESESEQPEVEQSSASGS
jgi:predicted dehydrogenase